MKIALVGATGNIGQRITAEATGRGHDVTAIARNTSSVPTGGHVTPVSADLADGDSVAQAVRGHDVLVVSVKFNGLDFNTVLDAARNSGVPRLFIVGGAASLQNADGQVLIDTPGFPEVVKVEAEPARQALNALREVTDVNWTFLSPAIMIGPGERTGVFRLGTEQVLVAEDGSSRISYEDYAVALVDELEHPKHEGGQRFTVGY
jgi:putative NADH-flavin reductase